MQNKNRSRHLWIAFQAACLLRVALHGALAAAAPHVVATIALPDPVRWDYVSVDPVSHRLYIAHRERVDVVDTRDHRLLLQLAPTPGVHGAAAAHDLNRVFTSNGADGTVGVFDETSGRLLQTVRAGKNPDTIVYEPMTHRVFAFNGGSSDVTAIDARTLQVLAASIPVPGKPEFAVVDGHGRVYFNIEDKSELGILDAPTLLMRSHYSLAPCEEPNGLAIDPRGWLYSVCRNAMLVVSDPAQGRVIGQAPIGHGADGVAWLDGKAYSANGRDGTISVVAQTVDGERFETIATVTSALGARTIAADPGEHLLFTPTSDFKPQPAAGVLKPGRPEPVSGTFRVLVFSPKVSRD